MLVKWNKVQLIRNVDCATFDESTVSSTKVYEWCKRFEDGREKVENNDCPGRFGTSTNIDITFGSCQEIFLDVLVMWNVWRKMFFWNRWISTENDVTSIRDCRIKSTTVQSSLKRWYNRWRNVVIGLWPSIQAEGKPLEEIKKQNRSSSHANTMPKSELRKCFRDWKKRWHEFVISVCVGGEDYFERDKVDVTDK